MKKLLKIIGYTLLTLLLVSFLALTMARFLSPVIVEKALVKDITKAGYRADVNVEIEKLGLFGVDIPEVKISLGSDEVELRNVIIDINTLITRGELKVNLGDLHLKVTDELLDYLELNGVSYEEAEALKGVNFTIDMESPFFLADSDDLYFEVGSFQLGFNDESGAFNTIETEGFKATLNIPADELIVTPLTILGNGAEIITFDEGIYSEDLENFRLGQVRIHQFQGLPEGKIGEMNVNVADNVVRVTSTGLELSEMPKYRDFFDTIITDPIEIEIREGEVNLDTIAYLEGDRKLLDDLGFDIELILRKNRVEITDGTILHRKFSSTIPFKLALEGKQMEVEVAGSKRWILDTEQPSEETISEMISFVLLKLASSIFGL